MQIGFYGDSFCKDNFHPKYETYISLLKKHYNADITHLGYGGSSHWDLIINQFQKDEHALPDVCIFVWTSHDRFYNKVVRGIRSSESLNYSKTRFKILPTYSYGLHRDIWKAAEQYYKHLYDENKVRLEYKSSLHYFDNVILEAHKHTKFIHLWSFGDWIKAYNKANDRWAPNNLTYMHTWKNGVEIRPSLMSIATRVEIDYDAPNHIPGKENNIFIFEKIKEAIEGYK
jgi:hypothetical protein